MTTNFEEKAINRMLKAGISLQHIQIGPSKEHPFMIFLWE